MKDSWLGQPVICNLPCPFQCGFNESKVSFGPAIFDISSSQNSEPFSFGPTFASVSLLPRIREHAASHSGLSHDVVFFRCAERAVPEQIFSATDIFRIMNRPEGQSGMPESMQVYAKSERCTSAPSDSVVDRVVVHGPAFVGNP